MAVPNILGNSAGIAIWQDAAAVVPWTIYQVYGDRRILEEQYDSIKCCVEHSRSRTEKDGLLHTGQQLGDWVALDMERGPMRALPEGMLNLELREKSGATDLYFIANAYYLYSISLMIKTAEVLGKQEDAVEYSRLYQEVLHSFPERIYHADGSSDIGNPNRLCTGSSVRAGGGKGPKAGAGGLEKIISGSIKPFNHRFCRNPVFMPCPFG